MSATGSTFKDWNAEEANVSRLRGGVAGGERRGPRHALLVDEDFSWSDTPPARSRRAELEPAPRAAVARKAWDEPLDVEHELDTAWGGRLSGHAGPAVEHAEAWDESTLEPIPDGPRTVVITGHGGERQVPMGRRRRDSDLRIHERAGFNPDRVAMWAVLLGVALLLGAVIH